jgi:hypothetical protein
MAKLEARQQVSRLPHLRKDNGRLYLAATAVTEDRGCGLRNALKLSRRSLARHCQSRDSPACLLVGDVRLLDQFRASNTHRPGAQALVLERTREEPGLPGARPRAETSQGSLTEVFGKPSGVLHDLDAIGNFACSSDSALMYSA